MLIYRDRSNVGSATRVEFAMREDEHESEGLSRLSPAACDATSEGERREEAPHRL